MEYDIFISYSRKDTAIVDQFVNGLTEAGYRVWIDREGIYSGDQWKIKIVQAIKNSSIVVFFSSESSNSSEFTIKEINIALDQKKPIHPIRIDKATYAESIYFDLVDVHYIQYEKGRLSSNINQLIASVAKHIDKGKSETNKVENFGSLPEKTSKHDSQPATHNSTPSQPEMSPEELFSLGKRHYNHNKYRQAAKCFQNAAEQGNAAAQFYLGNCYYYGHEGQQGCQKAVEWYRKAAEQGYAEAQFMLGICYEGVPGVQQDIKQAINWYRKAAKQGHEKAIGALDRLRFEGKLRRWPWS